MKKIKILLLTLAMIIFPLGVNAASGTISISGSSQVVVGNKITYTVKLYSSSGDLGSWKMILNYDSSYLKLVATTAEGGGTVMAASSTSGISTKTYTYTFTALKSGSTNISIGSYEAYAFSNFSEISLSSSPKSIRILTQAELEATYSKDNTLKSLAVEGFSLSQEFSNDVNEYKVVVPEGTETINIKASVNDSTATVEGIGEKEVTQGTNTFEIVVRAQNGAERTFKINVEVIDENPITISVNNEQYTVVKLANNLTKPDSYDETTIKIKEFDIPAFHSSITDFTLIGLKDSKGIINLFIYDNDSYTKYIEIKSGNLTIFPLKINDKLKDYTLSSVTINNTEIQCYTLKENSRIKIINGLNINTNEEGLFLYDSKDQSLIIYDDEYINILNSKINTLSLCCIIFSFTSLIAFIIIISLISKKNKIKKRVTSNKLVTTSSDMKEKNKKEVIEKDDNKTKSEKGSSYDNFEKKSKKSQKMVTK